MARNRFSGLFQFIIGFALGVFLLIGGMAALGFIFFSRLTAPPAKPIFAEEKTSPAPEVEAQVPEKSEVKEQQQEAIKSAAETTPKASPEEKSQEENLPPGAYKAKVNWSEGLSLRADPSKEAERIGGVEYNTQIVVLEKSGDGNWEKIRLSGSNQEGWIKAGNVERLGE